MLFQFVYDIVKTFSFYLKFLFRFTFQLSTTIFPSSLKSIINYIYILCQNYNILLYSPLPKYFLFVYGVIYFDTNLFTNK